MSNSSTRKTAARKTTRKSRPTTTRSVSRKAPVNNRQDNPKPAAKTAHGIHHRSASTFQAFAGDPQMPESVRAFAERSITQTREVYEQSLETVLKSWERFVDAAGQGAAAFNRAVIDMTRRNIHSNFCFAENLATARNLAEAMEVQAAHWRKQISELAVQSEEMRKISAKLTADVDAPHRAQATSGKRASLRAR